MTLGVAFEPGSDSAHFCKPTDVAVAEDGTIFVADGYCNRRIMIFDRQGRFISSLGEERECSGTEVFEETVPMGKTASVRKCP